MMSSSRNILVSGFQIAARNWPAIVWAYVFNLGLAFLFSLPLHSQITALTAHSLASQRLMMGFDLTVVADVFRTLSHGPGSAASASYVSTPIYLLLYFLLVPGTLFCYQTAAAPRLATLFQTGIAYFWRFVRITLISFVVFAIILGPLLLLQKAWSTHIDQTQVGRGAFEKELAAVFIIGLVAAALRVYFDLVEVYTVQLGLYLPPDKRIRRAFKPAWRALRHKFLQTYVSFVALAFIGLSAVMITARMAMHTLAQPRVWPAFLLAQVGLFVMLATRFWQRGVETALALEFPLAPQVVEPLAPITPMFIEPEPAYVKPLSLDS